MSLPSASTQPSSSQCPSANVEPKASLMAVLMALELSTHCDSILSEQVEAPAPRNRNAIVGVDMTLNNARPEVAALLRQHGAQEDVDYAYATADARATDGWISLKADYRRQNFDVVRELPQFDFHHASIVDAMFRINVRAARDLHDSQYYHRQRVTWREENSVFRADVLDPLFEYKNKSSDDSILRWERVQGYVRSVNHLPTCSNHDQVRWIPISVITALLSSKLVSYLSSGTIDIDHREMLTLGVAGKVAEKVGKVSFAKAQFLSRELGDPHLAMNEWEDKELGFITSYDVGQPAFNFVILNRELARLYHGFLKSRSRIPIDEHDLEALTAELYRDPDANVVASATISEMDCITVCLHKNHSHEWEHNSIHIQSVRRKNGKPCLTEIARNALGASFVDVQDIDDILETTVPTYTSDRFDIVISISYKHYDDGHRRISSEDKHFSRAVADQISRETGLLKIGFWLDKNRLYKLEGVGYEWLLQGIMQYGMLPVVITPSAVRNVNRFWIYAERQLAITGCGAIIPSSKFGMRKPRKRLGAWFRRRSKQSEANILHRTRPTYTFLDQFGFTTIEWLTRCENPETNEGDMQEIDVSVFDACVKILNTLPENEHGLESISRRLSGRVELDGQLNFCLMHRAMARAFFQLSGRKEVSYKAILRNWSPLVGALMIQYDWISGDLGQVTHFRWVVLAQNESSRECIVVFEVDLARSAASMMGNRMSCTGVKLLKEVRERQNVVLSVEPKWLLELDLKPLKIVATALDTDWKCGSPSEWLRRRLLSDSNQSSDA